MGKKNVENIRILCLLIVLLIVAVQAWRDQNQDWNQPIVVVLHPINADGLQTTQTYIHQLQNTDFQALKSYLSEWSQHYRGQSANFEIRLGQQLQQRPPEVPQNAGIFHVVWWSLKFRFMHGDNNSLKNIWSIAQTLFKLLRSHYQKFWCIRLL